MMINIVTSIMMINIITSSITSNITTHINGNLRCYSRCGPQLLHLSEYLMRIRCIHLNVKLGYTSRMI